MLTQVVKALGNKMLQAIHQRIADTSSGAIGGSAHTDLVRDVRSLLQSLVATHITDAIEVSLAFPL